MENGHPRGVEIRRKKRGRNKERIERNTIMPGLGRIRMTFNKN